MKNKSKILALTVATGLCLTTLTGCGNYDFVDMKFEFRYAVVRENDEHVLHQVQSWKGSESDSLTITTSCCENYIWSTANTTVMYKNKPSEESYARECVKE